MCSSDGKTLYHGKEDSLDMYRINITDPMNPYYMEPVVIPNFEGREMKKSILLWDDVILLSVPMEGLITIDVS